MSQNCVAAWAGRVSLHLNWAGGAVNWSTSTNTHVTLERSAIGGAARLPSVWRLVAVSDTLGFLIVPEDTTSACTESEALVSSLNAPAAYSDTIAHESTAQLCSAPAGDAVMARCHEVASSLGVSVGAVSGVEQRARAAGLDGPTAEALGDEALEARLYGDTQFCEYDRQRWSWSGSDCAARQESRVSANTPASVRSRGRCASPARLLLSSVRRAPSCSGRTASSRARSPARRSGTSSIGRTWSSWSSAP